MLNICNDMGKYKGSKRETSTVKMIKLSTQIECHPCP